MGQCVETAERRFKAWGSFVVSAGSKILQWTAAGGSRANVALGSSEEDQRGGAKNHDGGNGRRQNCVGKVRGKGRGGSRGEKIEGVRISHAVK